MSDSYEVYLECENAAFSLQEDYLTTGKVVGIYESNSENRPAITEKTVIISARGTSIDTIKDQYAIGDTVTVSCKPTNDATTFSQRKQWSQVTDATGGFFYLLKKGAEVGQPGNTTNYPCTIIGIKKDGTVLMTSTTSTQDGTREACQMTNLPALCKELGYHTAILFDGGGSTQMISLEGGSYVRRAGTPDGTNSVRSVISGLAVVYNGVNAEPTNKESSARVSLSGASDSTGSTSSADFTGSPSYAYKYYMTIETVNGVAQENLIGMRDTSFSSDMTTEEKTATIRPGTVTDVTLGEDCAITLSGSAFVNGGQGEHYWSIDKENWYLCTNGVYADGSDAQKETASANGGLNSLYVANAVFSGVTADLSAHPGETVDVYFGMTAKHDTTKICHYLTVENVTVPGEPATDTPDTPAVSYPYWDELKDVVLHQSFDELRTSATEGSIFTPGQSASWDYTAEVDETVTDLYYWGWLALPDEVGTFGYQIDGGEPVWDDSFVFTTEQGVYDAASGVAGYHTASRMLIKMDISGLSGDHVVRALYKNADGEAVIIGEFDLRRDAPSLETEPAETDPAETEPAETEPAETDPVETDPVETDPVETDGAGNDTDVSGEDTSAADTSAADTDETATVVTGGDDTSSDTASAEEDGCASAVGFGAVAVIMVAVAGAWVCKKKD